MDRTLSGEGSLFLLSGYRVSHCYPVFPPRDTTPFMCAHARGNSILPLGMRHVEALWRLGAWAVPLTVPVAHLGAGLRLLHWPCDGPASWPYVHSVHDY